jgi:hypothetical protein
MLHQIITAIQKRLKIKNNKKNYALWKSKGYKNTPLITFIIQSHNKSIEVGHIVQKLRKYPNSEIIVIEDGSHINHLIRIAKFLNRANEFVIRSNDLYENIMYDRAIRTANGQYIALMQDDDDFDNLLWIDTAVHLFQKYKKMVILGGNERRNFEVNANIGYDSSYTYTDNEAFSFVHIVNRAPMWINKTLYDKKLKHLDFDFAPFQYDDCELCLRSWLNGLQVGHYTAGFKSLSSGGMRIYNSLFAKEQYDRNQKKLYHLYGDKKSILDTLIDQANLTV